MTAKERTMGIMRTGRTYSTPLKAREALDSFAKRYDLIGRLDINFSGDGGVISHTAQTESWSARWLIAAVEDDVTHRISYRPTVFAAHHPMPYDSLLGRTQRVGADSSVERWAKLYAKNKSDRFTKNGITFIPLS
jgi:hypothetical protein